RESWMPSFLRIRSKVAGSGALIGRTSAFSARTTADLLPQPLAIFSLYDGGLQKSSDAARTLAKNGRLGEETDNEKCFGFKVVEESRLHQNVAVGKQIQGPFLLGSHPGHLESQIPAALDCERSGAGSSENLLGKFEILQGPVADLLLDKLSRGE